jgi:hypothetical protein
MLMAAQGGKDVKTYGNAIRVLLTNALGLSLALLEGVLVLELATHSGGDEESGMGVGRGQMRDVGVRWS